MTVLRTSTVEKEGPLQVAKWLHLPLLIDLAEMASLLGELPEVKIFSASRVVQRGEEEISREAFLSSYGAYVDALRSGDLLPPGQTRDLFSSLFTCAEEELYLVEAGEGRAIVRASRPVIQLQVHQIGYSPLDGKFRSMVFGKESISWGIQFSYPQVFQEGMTKRFFKVDDSFPNTASFRRLQRWVRYQTRATPFEVGGERINVPIRLGKNAFSWINNHPQLRQRNIRVSDAR